MLTVSGNNAFAVCDQECVMENFAPATELQSRKNISGTDLGSGRISSGDLGSGRIMSGKSGGTRVRK
jgi:hypothetical protein